MDVVRYYKYCRWNYLKKAVLYYRKHGFPSLMSRIKGEFSEDYNAWYKSCLQKDMIDIINDKIVFKTKPLISIIVPVYNTEITFLREMLTSVFDQVYDNWELCICDASDNINTSNYLSQYIGERKNVKVVKTFNKGISINTNLALALAQGEYISFLDHDDVLPPNCLYEVVRCINNNLKCDVIYTDEDKIDRKSQLFFDHHFKPDFSKNLLLNHNYITHFLTISAKLCRRIGDFDPKCDGAQDYDYILRCVDETQNIVHIPKVLYHWRVHEKSTALSSSNAKPYTHLAGKRALKKYLERHNIKANILDGADKKVSNFYRVKYFLKDKPKVSIIILNKDAVNYLKLCIDSIYDNPTYSNFELIIIENNSHDCETFKYYRYLKNTYSNILIRRLNEEFNFSKFNNFGASIASGDYLLFLNNDVELLTNTWLEDLLETCQGERVGAVGGKLLYTNGDVQHGGIAIGVGGVCVEEYKNMSANSYGYAFGLTAVREVSAITGALLFTPKSVFKQIGGFDESFKVAYNDIDYCLKCYREGLNVIYNGYVKAIHRESATRKSDDGGKNKLRLDYEESLLKEKWGQLKDPFYNKNLNRNKANYRI